MDSSSNSSPPPLPETDDPELRRERVVLDRIRHAQAAHLSRAVAQAERLADEAAEMAEEGIRDLFDADSEAEAAMEASMVRQASDRAMHAIRRVNQLRAAGRALAFGHTSDHSGDRTAIGRLTVFDEDDEPLLIDWRAPAAVPFYRATPLQRMGVERRRNLLYSDATSDNPGELVGYSDEVFDLEAATEEIGLRGEAALIASVTAPTREQMRSVVATIQAEQDAIIRAAGDEPLVVQGGPGTGKTVVALHRAAYLLYAQREALSDTGVLIVGPSPEFLTYIAGVLPSLGETGVVSVTAPELYPGVRRGRQEPAPVAEIKGRLGMVKVLATAVRNRQRLPSAPLGVWYGGRRVTIGVDRLQNLFKQAEQYATHNESADFFRFEVIETLTAEVFDPAFHNRQDARDHFRRNEAVQAFVLGHWPPLTPEQALNDLLGSKPLLRLAGRDSGIPNADLEALYRPRSSFADVDRVKWSNADIPLLDELLALLGISLGDQDLDRRTQERDEADEFEVAAAADAAADGDAADDGSSQGDSAGDPFDDADGAELVSLQRLAAAEDGSGMFDLSALDQRYDADLEPDPGPYVDEADSEGDSW
jgi:hypothetical protein